MSFVLIVCDWGGGGVVGGMLSPSAKAPPPPPPLFCGHRIALYTIVGRRSGSKVMKCVSWPFKGPRVFLLCRRKLGKILLNIFNILKACLCGITV